MIEVKTNSAFHINLLNIGTKTDDRKLYHVTDVNSKQDFNVSVNNNDADTFEKSISTLNDFGKNVKDPQKQKRNKVKAYATFLGLGLAGFLAPTLLTKNAKTLTKCLSIIGGTILGTIGGMCGFISCLIPEGYKNAQKAQQILQTLDIKIENSNNSQTS